MIATAAAPDLAPDSGLFGLQAALSANFPLPPPSQPEPPAPEIAAPAKSFLDLRSVPQLPLEQCRHAFSMLSHLFPKEWKEQVRQLRSSLDSTEIELRNQQQSLQVIALTSLLTSRARHGIAANLALALSSMQDMRVLLVDAKLSAPDLHTGLRIDAGPGLCEATHEIGDALPTCFRRITGSQFYLMTTGRPAAADVNHWHRDPVDARGLHRLFHNLRSQFDWIIVDAPAFDTAADAMNVTLTADGTLFLVKPEADNFRSLSHALAHVQGRLLGAVMV